MRIRIHALSASPIWCCLFIEMLTISHKKNTDSSDTLSGLAEGSGMACFGIALFGSDMYITLGFYSKPGSTQWIYFCGCSHAGSKNYTLATDSVFRWISCDRRNSDRKILAKDQRLQSNKVVNCSAPELALEAFDANTLHVKRLFIFGSNVARSYRLCTNTAHCQRTTFLTFVCATKLLKSLTEFNRHQFTSV